MKELQVEIAHWYTEQGYDKASPQTLTLGALEELGELSEAILTLLSDDFRPSPRKQAKDICLHNIAREVGDCITYLLALCNQLDTEPFFGWRKE